MYAMQHVQVCGIFSHFSVSDSHTADDLAFTAHQIELVERVLADLRAAVYDPGTTHLQNSYGILNYPQLSYDYVRPGLLYMGVTSDDEIAINTAPDFLSLIHICAPAKMPNNGLEKEVISSMNAGSSRSGSMAVLIISMPMNKTPRPAKIVPT